MKITAKKPTMVVTAVFTWSVVFNPETVKVADSVQELALVLVMPHILKLCFQVLAMLGNECVERFHLEELSPTRDIRAGIKVPLTSI